jgi:hypothetical protein
MAEGLDGVMAGTFSMGVGDKAQWGPIHTSVIAGNGPNRSPEEVAAETSELFTTVRGLGRVVIGDAVMQGARGEGRQTEGYSPIVPGTPASFRYVTHEARQQHGAIFA